MQFSPLPSLPTPVSSPANSSHGLGGYYSLASGLINAVRPGKLPHSTRALWFIIHVIVLLWTFVSDAVAQVVSITNEELNLGWGIPPPETGTQGIINEVGSYCSHTIIHIGRGHNRNISVQFLMWLAPAIAAVALGLLLAVVIPITGCCIVCCRKNGYCGAKSRLYRKKHQNVKCFVYTCTFLVSNAMIMYEYTTG